MQCVAHHNFLHQKIPYLHALQGNGEMGARYLDPKYSRWISVDPALGEYVPGAGKANAKDAGGLPGMGGLFNSVNLSLFHYAGNNPVRYADFYGKKTSLLTDKQWEQVSDALSRLSANLETIIKSLSSVDKSTDLSIFNKKIVEAAKCFINSNFGDNNYDFKGLAHLLSRVKLRVDSLSRTDFLYNDKMDSYAWTYPFFSKQITLGNKFFDAIMTDGYDTKEGIILHEVTHQFSLFGTIDITYDFSECKELSNFWKRNNANNWEYFYETVYSF